MEDFQKSDKFDKSDDKGKRIGRLDQQTLGYYRRVSETLVDDFPTVEEKELFLNNVFNQLSQEAFSASQNQTVSHIVENLLHFANRRQFQQFMNALAKDWELACTDRFACHVTQTLVIHSSQFLTANETDTSSSDSGENLSELRTIRELFLELVTFLVNSLALYMQHTYASHILRAIFEVLAGKKVSENVIRSKVSREGKKKLEETISLLPPDSALLEVLHDICEKVICLPRLSDHVKHQLSNPVLQTVLLIMKEHDEKKFNKFCKKLIKSTEMFTCVENSIEGEEDKEEIALPELVADEVASRLIEQLLPIISEKLYSNLFEKHMKDYLVPMSLHHTANFVAQAVIANTRTSEQYETAFMEVADKMETILANNHMGVIVQLCKGALRHGTKQKAFCKNLLSAFHCYDPVERRKECVTLISLMTTYDVMHEENENEKTADTFYKVNIHGSLLLQTLLKFGDPKLIVTSLLQMKKPHLVYMACDPCGSHIIDAFMNSKPVGEKSRDALVQNLKGSFSELACSKNGSRTLEAIWAAVPVKLRCIIAEHLIQVSGRLQSDRFGRFIWHNFGLHSFTQRRSEWKDAQMNNVKKRKLFEDIIGKSKQVGDKRKKTEMSSDMVSHEDGDASLVLQDDEEVKNIEIDELFSVKKRSQSSTMQYGEKQKGKHKKSNK